MIDSQEPAAGNKEENSSEEERQVKINKKLEDKSPAKIYLINKELNPMFGILSQRKSSQEKIDEVNSTDEKITEKETDKLADKNKIKSVKKKLQRGIVSRGFDFVKDNLKKNRNK